MHDSPDLTKTTTDYDVNNDDHPMTVADLKVYLADKPDDAVVEFSVQTYTQRYPSLYLNVMSTLRKHGYEFWMRYFPDTHGTPKVRISLNAGEGVIISKRKSK